MAGWEQEQARKRMAEGGGDRKSGSAVLHEAVIEDKGRTNEHLARAAALGPDLHAVVGTSLGKAGGCLRYHACRDPQSAPPETLSPELPLASLAPNARATIPGIRLGSLLQAARRVRTSKGRSANPRAPTSQRLRPAGKPAIAAGTSCRAGAAQPYRTRSSSLHFVV